MARILVIDGDDRIRKFLRVSLGASGYDISEAGTAADGLAACRDAPPDLVILELDLPDMGGLEVISVVRRFSELPIVVVSSLTDEAAKVEALDRGGDDYVVKPFGIAELMARVRAALRHNLAAPAAGIVQIGSLAIDLGRRLAIVGGAVVRLSRTEFDLLAVLASRPGHVMSHQEILAAAWGEERAGNSDYLRVLIHQLRKKLEKNPARPEIVIAEPGVGYRLKGGQAR